jgi:hypothetical protein
LAEDTVKGYRILGDRPKDRTLSMDYLQQSPKASKLLRELWDRAPKEGANCVGKPEKWTSDELPTDREAQIMCAGCPLAQLCSDYAEAAHPAWGVYAGRVYGRKLDEAMKEAE